ncbi:MAG: transposase [Bdellovibrionales bacterium]
MKQQNLFKYLNNNRESVNSAAMSINSNSEWPATHSGAFGGELIQGKRKLRRPLDIKKPIHLVLRADISKSGSLLRRQNQINKMIYKYAIKFGVKVYKKAIVSNHIHFVLKFSHRFNYTSFVRALSGVLAKSFGVKWKFRPFTRVITWGRDFKNTLKYVLRNELEALGVITYQPRKSRRLKSYVDPRTRRRPVIIELVQSV